MLKKVQSRYNDILFDQNKLEATRLHQTGEYVKALEYYEKCLKITRKATTLNNIGVFVNKTACLHMLEYHSRCVTECNNALRLVKNYQHKAMNAEEKEKVH